MSSEFQCVHGIRVRQTADGEVSTIHDRGDASCFREEHRTGTNAVIYTQREVTRVIAAAPHFGQRPVSRTLANAVRERVKLL
jgi:hypothetical protein